MKKPPQSQENSPEAIYARIQRRLKAVDKSELGAATEAGLGRDAIRDVRRKPKNLPSIRTLERLAPVLETTPWWLAFGFGEEEAAYESDDPEKEHMVPVVGYVGEGGHVHFYAVAQGDLEKAPAPKGSTEHTVAVEIRGDTSLGSMLDRWIAFYDNTKSQSLPDLVGHLCIAWLADSRVLMKRLQRARGGKDYDLVSQTEQNDVPGAKITRAVRVKLMAPK